MVLTIFWPLANCARHAWSNLVAAPSRRRRASAGVAGPFPGSNALLAFAFGNAFFFRTRLKNKPLTIGRKKVGNAGNLDGAPETTFADSSKTSATCSTTWHGDHF